MPSERTSRRGCDRWLDDLSAGEISTPLEFVIYLSTLVFRVRVSFVSFFSSFRYFIICSGSRESVQRRVVDPLRASGDAIEAREGQPFLGLYIKKKKTNTSFISDFLPRTSLDRRSTNTLGVAARSISFQSPVKQGQMALKSVLQFLNCDSAADVGGKWGREGPGDERKAEGEGTESIAGMKDRFRGGMRFAEEIENGSRDAM